jgi:hypothetical protein
LRALLILNSGDFGVFSINPASQSSNRIPMDRAIKRLDTVGRYPGTAITFGLLSILSNVFGVLGFFGLNSASPQVYAALLAISFLATGVILSLLCTAIIRIYVENKRIKDCFEKFHDVAHYFRNDLCFRLKNQKKFTKEQILQHEVTTLTKICGCVSSMFTTLISRDCHVCVTLLQRSTENNVEKTTCFIWASSSLTAGREVGKEIEINVADDIRFSEAGKIAQDGPSHFYSADLKADAERLPDEKQAPYRNVGAHFVSCLVVPLRLQEFKEAEAEITSKADGIPSSVRTKVTVPSQLVPASPLCTLGFLKVETKSGYRLNNRWHKYLLAAFADLVASQLALRDIDAKEEAA